MQYENIHRKTIIVFGLLILSLLTVWYFPSDTFTQAKPSTFRETLSAFKGNRPKNLPGAESSYYYILDVKSDYVIIQTMSKQRGEEVKWVEGAQTIIPFHAIQKLSVSSDGTLEDIVLVVKDERFQFYK